MRAFDVNLFKFSARTNVQDFDGLARFKQSFEFECVNCFHNVPSGSKHKGARAPALIVRWLLLRISCPDPQGKPQDSLRIFSEMLDPACLTAAFFDLINGRLWKETHRHHRSRRSA